MRKCVKYCMETKYTQEHHEDYFVLTIVIDSVI